MESDESLDRNAVFKPKINKNSQKLAIKRKSTMMNPDDVYGTTAAHLASSARFGA